MHVLLLLLLILFHSSRLRFVSADNCNGPLVSVLPHASFQGSSQSSGTYAAYNAKLNRRDGESTFPCVAAPGPPAVATRWPPELNGKGGRP